MRKNFLNHRLLNEATDLGDSGGNEAFDYSSNEVIGDNDEQAFKDHGLDLNKYGFDKEEVELETESESQGSETEEGAGPQDENALLERINALGAIHNELPVKVESLEELKNLVQMGKDYTLKTQTLSEERKAWDAEKSGAENELNAAIQEFNKSQGEYQEQIQELQNWTFTLNQLKESAPDIFDEVQRAYNGTVQQFKNPILDQQLAAIRAELAETKKGLTSREDKLIVDKFETDKASMAATEQSMKELGVNIDWNEVKKEWASSGLEVKKVIGAMYFDQMTKAQASKAKVEATKAKVSARPVATGSKSRPGNQVKAIDPKLSGLQYASALLDRYKNI